MKKLEQELTDTEAGRTNSKRHIRWMLGNVMKSFLLIAILLTIMTCGGFAQENLDTIVKQSFSNIDEICNSSLQQLNRNRYSMTHEAYDRENNRIEKQRISEKQKIVNMINNGAGSAAETVPIRARPHRTVKSASDTYMPRIGTDSSTEETQSSSIGCQPPSISNKKQVGSYNAISEEPGSRISYGNDDKAKNLEDQRGRDEWDAQEKNNQQDKENRQIKSRAFQLENDIRNSQHSSRPNYRGMATEADFLSQDASKAGNSGAAFNFGNAASKLNQMSRDSDSFNRNSSFGSQDMNGKRREAESSVFFGGASVR